MKPVKPCQECGALLPPDAPSGLCPKCLMGLSQLPPEPDTEQPEDYELLGIIGRGAMSDVYSARQISLNRMVAIKTLNAHSAAFPELASRLRIEAEATASLRHPNIVTVYGVGEHEGYPFFSMELIEGAGMNKFIGPDGFHFPGLEHKSPAHKRSGPQAAIALVLSKIARALHYAHQHGVLHRDVKPANVLIDSAGEPRLTDFGLAKILDKELVGGTRPGVVQGTLPYMPPEQAAGKQTTTESDIYSLGATLYEMLTGHTPFEGETTAGILSQVIDAQPKDPSNLNSSVDPDLEIVCLKCLQKHPQKRYNSAEALAEELERWLRGEPIEARAPKPLERVWRWCRREPRLAAMTAAVLFLLLAITALSLHMYVRQKAQLETAERLRTRAQNQLRVRIDREWGQSGNAAISLDPYDLAVLGNRDPSVNTGTKLVLGVYATRPTENPERIADAYEPFLYALQSRLVALKGLGVDWTLRIHKCKDDAVAGLLNGQVDLLPLTPPAYFLIRQTNDALVLLVKQISRSAPEPVAIFTSRASGIKDLVQLRGRSFSFGDPDAPLSQDHVKAALTDAGIGAKDLTITNILSRMIISAVSNRRVDAGVAPVHQIDSLNRAHGLGLVKLKGISSPGVPWVCTTNWPPDVVARTRDALLSLRGSSVLLQVDNDLAGFDRASPSEYDCLEQQIELARRFDEAESARRKENVDPQ